MAQSFHLGFTSGIHPQCDGDRSRTEIAEIRRDAPSVAVEPYGYGTLGKREYRRGVRGTLCHPDLPVHPRLHGVVVLLENEAVAVPLIEHPGDDHDRVAPPCHRPSGEQRVGLAPPFELILSTRDSAAAMGLAPPQELRGGSGDVAVRQVAETLQVWTTGPDSVTAICCFNDLFAGLVIAAARTVGLRVPQDLSVIGVDDEPLGGVLQPALTTVQYDFQKTAAHIEARLRAALDGKPAPRQPSSGAIEVTERESVAPLAT